MRSAGWSRAKHAIPEAPAPSGLAAELAAARASAQASFTLLERALGMRRAGSGSGSGSGSGEDLLSWLAWALNTKALLARPLAALGSLRAGNPLLRAGKVAVLGVVPALGAAAALLARAPRLLGLEAQAGHVLAHPQLGRLVSVPGSAHASWAWPLLALPMAYWLALAVARACQRAPA